MKIIIDFRSLKSYYKRFLTNETSTIDLKQRFPEDIRLIKKVKKAIPWKVTCLMECMAISEYFKRYKIYIPISIGLCSGEEFSAHAWNGTTNRIGKYQKIQIL
jgi:hypothetical protein